MTFSITRFSRPVPSVLTTLLAFAGCSSSAPEDDAHTSASVAASALSSTVALQANYTLVRQDSGKCLDVTGAGAGNGTSIEQWTCNGLNNQLFRVDDAGGGNVRLVDQNTQKCVDVNGSGTADGTKIQLWDCNGTAAQAYAVEDTAGGYARIRNVNSDKCLDVGNSSTADGAMVQLWTCNASAAQNWQVRRQSGDPGDPAAPPVVNVSGQILTMSTGAVQIAYDLSTGTATFSYGGMKRISNFYAGVQLATYVTSKMYTSRAYTTNGNQVIVTSTGNGLPTMQQLFALGGRHGLLVRVMVLGSTSGTNWIAPVVMDTRGGVDIGSYTDARLLWIPFDNDAWVSYNAMPINNAGVSFEAAAFYDNSTRNGIVVGSVTHDTWKTGVQYAGSNNRLDILNVFGGATDPTWTHDVVPHAQVSGSVLYSPIVFIGYGPDWRDLMEEYADANAQFTPKLAWSGGVPVGWNSWGKIQANINYDKAVTVSDAIKSNLQGADFNNNGVVYVNLDSFWDNMSDAQLAQFVAHCRSNGQKAGIYWAPFVDWGKSAGQPVDGAPAYTYSQIWLRDANGNPIAVDGAYAVDPTHAGTKARIAYQIDRFKNLGFEYIKLDFLGHGALESTVRYDQNARTGIQAYNQGMAYLRDRIAGSMFISESIAPLFPSGYAHARRVSCDTFGAATGLGGSQYELNSATYGWWLSGRLYQYNDPDHIVLEGFSANENMTRLISSVVSGTVFLDGDDLTGSTGQALARTYLTNSRINQVARLGRAFRPLDGNTGTNPSDVLMLQNDGTTYLALFNFGQSSVSRAVNLPRAGLDGGRAYNVTDLWTGETWTAQGTLTASVGAKYARLLQLK